ncbi:MAG: inositol monophosphatase [Lactobacillales bacterium]|jgi:myo-inositol-1(or 4)-monophosphatase|nr:inositol monophosphatase [Lactobacillales bacterium]
MSFVPVEKRRITPRPDTMRKRPETREDKMIDALSPNLNIMVKGVRKAGAKMIRDFGEVSSLQVSQKGPGDFVSNADIMAERTLIEYFSEARPDYGFILEEGDDQKARNESPFTWIIDPIDGTNNFLHATPFFAISVALLYKEEVIAAVTYNPITNHLYYAEKGKGAFLMTPTGNIRLRVSGRTRMSIALLGSNAFRSPKNTAAMEKIADEVASVRYYGATTLSLAMVAAGQLDAYVATQFKLWDVAAGYLLIKEAGGFVADFEGRAEIKELVKSQTLIATNMALKDTFLKKMKGN